MSKVDYEAGGTRTLSHLCLCLLLLALGTLPGPARAQTVQGQLLDRETLAPVEGALILLLGAQGEEIDGYLTNAAGRFILQAGDAGTYRVRADRIGYKTVTSEPFTLAARQIFGLRLETVETAIQLEELRVEGEQQCLVRPEEGMDLARVWEEARKALTVQEWTEREGMFRFQVVNYVRELDPNTRRVLDEDRQVSTGVARSPIRSLPVRELMEEGFIQRNEDGGLDYFGPDATVLLSDEFLDTHCFHLRSERDRPESLGLAFEPMRGADLPDIQGTLWLDRQTAALQFLEYGYTWAEHPEARGVARGRVEFEELPGGAWIVRKWWIRMPELSQDLFLARSGRSGVFLSGVREAGGEVAQVSTLDRRRINQVERGILGGLVWDSTRYRPLEGANVYLSGTSYSAVTDAEGRFLMEGIPEGVFSAVFTHPRLDTLGILAQGVEVSISPGGFTEVLLGVPSSGSILVEACRGEGRARGSAVIAGTVRKKEGGEPIPRAMVRLDWQEVSRFGPGGLTGQQKWYEASTDSEGRYTVCSVPPEELIVIQARFMDRRSDTVHVRVLEDTYTVVNLEIGLPPGWLQEGLGAATPLAWGGLQGVQGHVLETETGQPVRDAEVTLRQAPGATGVSRRRISGGSSAWRPQIPGASSCRSKPSATRGPGSSTARGGSRGSASWRGSGSPAGGSTSAGPWFTWTDI